MKKTFTKIFAFFMSLTLIFSSFNITFAATKKTSDLRLASDWPYPFHGNPFGPGAVGGAWWFVYEPFAYYIPQTGQYIPRLAEKWTINGNKLTVYLRKNAKWSDGKAFTAQDVVNTVAFIQAMWQWPYEIQTVRAINPNTVEFTLWKEAPASFMHTILTDGAMGSLVPYHVYSKWNAQARQVSELGKKIFYDTQAGKAVSDETKKQYEALSSALRDQINKFSPYKTLKRMPVVGAYEPTKIIQSEMVLSKNKYHWLANKNTTERVVFRRWSSNEFVWASLVSGELDAAHPNMPKDVVEQLKFINPNLNVKTVSDLSEIALVFNFNNKLFKDINLRKAIAYLLEKNKVKDVSVWQANAAGQYYTGVLSSMQSKWVNSTTLSKMTKYATSTASAENILKKAGYAKKNNQWYTPSNEPVGFVLSVYGPHNDWVLAAREVVQQFNKFGFKVEMKLIPDGMRDQVMRSGDYECAIEFGSAWWGYPHPMTGYSRLYQGDIANITAFPSKEKFNTPWGQYSPYDLVNELKDNINNSKKATEIIQKLAYITNEYLPVVPLFEKVLPIYYSSARLTGWPSAQDGRWSLAPGGIERLYNLLITEGVLKSK